MIESCKVRLRKNENRAVPVIIEGREDLDNFYRSLEPGDEVEAVLEKEVTDHSWVQVKKVHKLMRIMSEESGYSVEEIKMLVKYNTGYAYAKIIDGERYVIPIKSIGSMSKKELTAFIEAVLNYAATKMDLVLE